MTKEYNIPELAAQVAAYSRKPRLSKAARERLLARFKEDELKHETDVMGAVTPLRPHLVKALPVANVAVAPEVAMAAKTSGMDTGMIKDPIKVDIENDGQLRPLLFSLDFEDSYTVKLFADFSANSVFATVHHVDELKDHGKGQQSHNKTIEIGKYTLELDLVDETQALYRFRDTSVAKIFAVLHEASEK
jgi:hypothetical protein